MSKIEVNTIEPQCGTTLTLGANNDKVVLGTGAAFSGGIGAVNWETTVQAGDFGAVSGKGYFVNSTAASRTVTLPSSPSVGDIVAVKDYTGTASTNAITVARGGSNIRSAASDFALEKDHAGATFVYVDGTEGWQVFVNGSDTDVQQTYICASGGSITTSGDYKIHTFTGPGTFTVNSAGCSSVNDKVDYLVVAGGGGAGTGGGGAGGYRESAGTDSGSYTRSPLGACVSSLTVTAQGYPVTVGAGGTAGASCSPKGGNGANSVFSTITSTGGGGGASYQPGNAAQTGGSGGGGAYSGPNTGGAAGNTPPVSPPQGNTGGNGSPSAPPQTGGGGGGATAAGSGKNGGAGATSSINATPTARAGGGGAGGFQSPHPGGTGGAGGGANGADGTASSPGNTGTAGTTNTGGGGGGSGYYGGAPNPGIAAGAGGSGIVIIRYKYQ